MSLVRSQPADGIPPAPRHGHLQEFRRRWVRHLMQFVLRSDGELCKAGGLPVNGIHRVLVLRPNHRLGNTLLATPLVAELARLYPGAEVDIVGAGDAAPAVFSTFPTVRHVVMLHHRMVRHLPATLLTLWRMRETRYDLAIDAGTGSQSGRLLLALARARFKIGVDRQEHRSDATRPPHHAWRAVHLLRRAYAGKAEGPWPAMSIGLSRHELAQGQLLLNQIAGPVPSHATVTVAIFANATGSKRYGETWWTEFIASLTNHYPNARIVEVVAAHAVSQLNSRHPTFYTRDLRKMAAFIAASDVFVSADCGVMHLAAASGTPTFGLFSVTDSSKYAPYGQGNIAIDNSAGDPDAAAGIVATRLENLRLVNRISDNANDAQDA